jgi:hypothetical protein
MHRSPASLLAASLALVACACGGSEDTGQQTATPGPRAQPGAAPAASRPGAGAGTRRDGVDAEGVAWPKDRLLRRLDGRRVRVRGQAVRLDPATLTCGGVGRARPGRHGAPAWTSFRCIQPTFPRGAVAGPDLVFTVVPTGARRFAISGARLTRY